MSDQKKVEAVVLRPLRHGAAVYSSGQRMTLTDSPVVKVFEREGVISVNRDPPPLNASRPAPAEEPVDEPCDGEDE